MKTFADYTIYCTEEQVQRLKKLNAPIAPYSDDKRDKYYKKRPTAEQVIGWLRDSQGIQIDIFTDNGRVLCDVNRMKDLHVIDFVEELCYNTAILKAIDTALNYLEKQKQ